MQTQNILLASLLAIAQSANYDDGITPHARNNAAGSRKKTKPGAVHNHRPTFKSRSVLDVTPAEYRR